MADPDALGTLIRSARLEKGLSLGQLASAVSRSPSSVRRWERGETAPSRDVVNELATALGLDGEEFATMVASAHAHETGSAVVPHDDDEESSSEPAVSRNVRTTIEDDDLAAQSVPYFETSYPVAPLPTHPQPSRYGRASSAVWGRRDSWIGWVRGFLTVLALFFLFMGLMWAGGELLTALRDALGSFSTGG